MKTVNYTGITQIVLILLLLAGVLSATGYNETVPEELVTVFDPHMLSNMFVEISELVGPSVVTITSQTTVVTRVPSFPDFSHPFMLDPWGDYFQMPREQEYTMTGIGSGVIVSVDGMILTNHHVVGEADELEVVLQSGERYPGVIVGTDPETDLAVIRIDAFDLPAIAIGDSDELKVGQWVLAVGSPFALSQTVTHGIISYIGRSDVGLAEYEDYIQTDAAINPGNSGGALVDLDGYLVGVNTAIATRTGGYQGVGFAIPVNVAVDVMEDLVSFGYVKRGWLGVTIQELTPGLAGHFGLDAREGGVLVSQVLSDTPAGAYGIHRGDVILTVDGESFRTITEFRNMIADIDPGNEVEIGVFRDGRNLSIPVILGERAVDETIVSSAPSNLDDFGWTLEELNRETAETLGDPSLRGILVVDVSQTGRASGVGIYPGDVIIEVDGFEVTSPEELNRLISSTDDVLLLILRQGHSVYFMM
ncbi:MAG: Do family serine endopeptidase [Candidatus Aegiribacteria sp.]|nr:Do family serine endopeptidase [Candidatus Aegiribacteria sp.]